MAITKQQWNNLILTYFSNALGSRGWGNPLPNHLCYQDMNLIFETNNSNVLTVTYSKDAHGSFDRVLVRSYMIDAQRGKFVIKIKNSLGKIVTNSTLNLGIMRTEQDVNNALYKLYNLISTDISLPSN